MARTHIVLALAVAGCAGSVPRQIFLNSERRSITELATEIGFPLDERYLDDVAVGVVATLALRACFPTNDDIASIWWRSILVERDGDRAIVSLQKERLVDRRHARFRLERDPDACLDRLAVLLPTGTPVDKALNQPLALMRWGRSEPHEASLRRVLMEMQVVQTLQQRCFPDHSAQGDVLLAWGELSVRVLDIRNGDFDEGNACSKRFELAYPIDVAGHPMTPRDDVALTELSFSAASYSIAETRADWGVRD